MSDLSHLPLTLRRHGKAMFPATVFGLFIIAVAVLVAKVWPSDWGYWWIPQVIFVLLFIAAFVVPLMRWFSETFTITDRSVKNDWGVLYRQSREIDLTRIASISEERGILDRVFGCGTLNFYDAAATAQPHTSGIWNKGDNTQAGVRFHDVPDVKEIRSLVEEAKRAALTIH